MNLEEKLERLRQIEYKSNISRELNQLAAIEEHKRDNLPANWENKRKRLQWQEDDDNYKEECKKNGLDAKRMKYLDVPAFAADKSERKKKAKIFKAKNPINFEDATYKKYVRLTKELKPDMVAYAREKAELAKLQKIAGYELMPIKNKDSKANIDALAEDMKAQIARKTAAKQRRKRFNSDAAVTYINEKNKRFNDQLAKFYGECTAELHENLERGTAL